MLILLLNCERKASIVLPNNKEIVAAAIYGCNDPDKKFPS
jgi:hypothetical protein